MEDIRLLSDEALFKWIADHGQPTFRGKQVIEWLWQKGAKSFDQCTNLPKSLREALSQSFEIRSIQRDMTQQSADGTIKLRYKLYDGHKIEAVLIPAPIDGRFTVCVSTQVGCSLTCKFCATGRMGRIRNLDFPEIFDQVYDVNEIANEYFGHSLTNIVYMGMGEPLLNYTHTIKSIEKIASPKGLGYSPSRITVSTAGIAKMIKKLADDQPKVNLALSLHAPTDEKRNRIMPINDQNNIQVLMDALEYYHQTTDNRPTFEYIALAGFNDGVEDAIALSKLTHRFPVKINIIEYNPVDGLEFTKSTETQLNRFLKALVERNVRVTVRRSRGKDIDAACGQLANKQ